MAAPSTSLTVLDAHSGLYIYYLRARYYDPTSAQFMSRDPLVAMTMSPYAYVSGNLLNGTDPSGLCSGLDLECRAAEAAAAAKNAASNAKNWVGDQLPNCTVFGGNCAPVIKSAGVCAGGGVFGGIGAMGSVCIVEANGYQHGGVTWSGGYGLGLGASAGPSIAISNANSVEGFGGPFVGAGGSYGIGSADLQVSPDANACGGHTWVASGGVGPGTPGGHVDATNTGTWKLWG